MMLPRMQDSPMPIHTVSGLESDTATAPTEELVMSPSVTALQLLPASVVFQRPPPTAPKYASRGRPFTPDTAIERPPRAGPMLRQRYEFSNASLIDGVGAGGGACADTEIVSAAMARQIQRFIRGSLARF